MSPIHFKPNYSPQNTNQFSIPEVQGIRGNRNPWTRSNHKGPTTFISSREIVGIHIFRRGTIPFKVDMKGAQRLNGSLFAPKYRCTMHHMMVEPEADITNNKRDLEDLVEDGC
jgi:hypothetical protein